MKFTVKDVNIESLMKHI